MGKQKLIREGFTLTKMSIVYSLCVVTLNVFYLFCQCEQFDENSHEKCLLKTTL
jgi:hypothetical protein